MIPTTKEIRDFLEGYCLDIKSVAIFSGDLDGFTISNVDDFTHVKINNIVKNQYVPAGTRVADFDEDTSTITLDTEATSTEADQDFTIEYYDAISEDWLIKRRDNFVVPMLQDAIGTDFSEIKTVTEYYSGNGGSLLILDRRPIIEVTGLSYVNVTEQTENLLQSIKVIADQGILKSSLNFSEGSQEPVFPSGKYNIKVTYTYGYENLPNDLKEAIIYWVSKLLLVQIGARTGGGSISGQSWSRQFGQRGKWTDIVNELDGMIYAIMRKYVSGVVGA